MLALFSLQSSLMDRNQYIDKLFSRTLDHLKKKNVARKTVKLLHVNIQTFDFSHKLMNSRSNCFGVLIRTVASDLSKFQ